MLVACVWTGSKYKISYVQKLKRMVERHLHCHHEFICFTDQPKELDKVGIHRIDIADLHLKSWWGKMALFAPKWREGQRVLYFDLDTVIVDKLDDLAELDVTFGICENFTRAAGFLDWPCKYGSCVMTIGPGFDGDLFRRFWIDRYNIMARAGKYGDQKAIEDLGIGASILQSRLPSFFLGYRDLVNHKSVKPAGCSLVIFAGKTKPHDCEVEWVRREWAHR